MHKSDDNNAGNAKRSSTTIIELSFKINATFSHLFHVFYLLIRKFSCNLLLYRLPLPIFKFHLTSESMLLTGTMTCGGFCRQSCYFSSVFRLVSWIGTWQTWKFPILLYSTQTLRPFGLMNHRLRLHQHRARPPCKYIPILYRTRSAELCSFSCSYRVKVVQMVDWQHYSRPTEISCTRFFVSSSQADMFAFLSHITAIFLSEYYFNKLTKWILL